MKISRDDAILLLIDFQERLMPAIFGKEKLEQRLNKLIKGCGIMDLPVIVTQQYTKGLGETIASVRGEFSDFNPIEKTSFSCCGAQEFVDELEKTRRRTVIVAGIETHICVLQTVNDLLDRGFKVFLVSDCSGSRDENDRIYGEDRMRCEGARIVTMESVLFELCVDSKCDGFKEISKLVK